ncbi:MAG: transglycosylase SLT domain-containing protein [Microgenomates group bacterium]|jgi:hypothetical protein
MGKERENKKSSKKYESSPTFQELAFLGVWYTLKGAWKTLDLTSKAISTAAELSWKFPVKPFFEHVGIPVTVWGAKQTAKGSERLFNWSVQQYKTPVAMSFELGSRKLSLRAKLGNLGVIGAVTMGSIINTASPWVTSGVQAAAETYHNGNEFLENLNRELAYKGDISQNNKPEEIKPTVTVVPRQEALSTVTPIKVAETPVSTKTPESAKIPEYTKESNFENPFAGVRANEIAKELGMNAGSFYQVSPFTMESLKKFNNGKLLKIFPPSVMQYKDQIEKLAKQYAISPNIVALIMTIESQGDKNAGSEAGAKGLMQVMPNHFPANMTDAQMKEVLTNIEKGINVFITFYNYSKQNNTGYANMMGKALMGYNGGGRGVTMDYEQLIANKMGETCFYGEHVIRFILSLEIAVRLREEGYSEADIVKQLRSEEIEARAYALRTSGFDGIRSYLSVTQLLADKNFKGSPGLKNNYDKYKSTPSLKINFPGTPGLVIFWGSGGSSFTQMDINKNQNNWN